MLPLEMDDNDIRQTAALLDGFLFTGGHDVSPSLYNEKKLPECGVICPERDHLEQRLFVRAREMDKPVLGICRGIQIMNVAFGGTLYQDVSLHGPGTMRHSQREIMPGGISHKVIIEEGSILHRLYGKELWTNSYHHQAIKDLGEGLRVTARAEDGIIEAVEAVDHPYMHAVQWHPESFFVRKANYMLPIFEDFIKACK